MRTHADFQSWYWEEFHRVSRFHPETQVFGNEWSGGYHKGSVHPLAPSCLDFQCWYGAEFIRRGIGLYFDNTFPKQGKDPLTTEAYRMPNGRLQASAKTMLRRLGSAMISANGCCSKETAKLWCCFARGTRKRKT